MTRRTTIDLVRVAFLKREGRTTAQIGRILAAEEGRAIAYGQESIRRALRITGPYLSVVNHKNQRVFQPAKP